MRSATLITSLTGLTVAMAVAAPLVVFGFLYVLQVQPERAAAAAARSDVERAIGDLNRQRPSTTPAARDSEEDFTAALTRLSNSAAVGGVSNLFVAQGATGTPVTVTFDAEPGKVARFLDGLGALPDVAELRSVEMESLGSGGRGLMRARVSFDRRGAGTGRRPRSY